MSFFDINNTFLTIAEYNLSYLEFTGTIFNLWCVVLASRNNIFNWLIGNIGSVLFAILFFQIQLYADLFEQIYFIIAGFFGWWVWSKGRKDSKTPLIISFCTKQQNALCFILIIAGTVLMTWVAMQLPAILPEIFLKPASYPWLDSFTTVMSIAATILMAYRKIEAWFLWILVDIIGIWLYFVKGVVFVSGLYVMFLALATYGFISWHKIWNESKKV